MSDYQHLVLGTAGHIDHGKTALIKALTGADTDRLKEEKDRGISIELGYAELVLPSGTKLSVVDVPGHERFVRNMVAGATGIDIFMLVVAANDGVMPQTREHMAIIEMLAIPRGVVAITKTDLVDEEMLELVRADVEDYLSGSSYADTPLVAISSKTGQGLPELLGLLEEAADQIEVHRAEGAARLPIDRVFTLKGIGTVVTGTLWSGQICAEDSIRVLPDELEARARSVQVHDHQVDCATAGSRVAVNLSGIDKDRLERGQMIVKGDFIPTYMVDAHIRLLDTAPTLKYGAQVRFHHGTADATAKLMFADRERLAPGDDCYAQVRLKTKLVPAKGDRFIIRSLTPVTTIGGGVVLDPHPHKHGIGEEHRSRLETLEQGGPEEVAAMMLAEAAPGGLTRDELQSRSEISGEQLAEMVSSGKITGAATGQGLDLVFHPDAAASFQEGALAALGQKQERSPAEPSLNPEQLAKVVGLAADSRDFQALITTLIDAGEVSASGQRYQLASAEAKLSGGQSQLMEKVMRALKEGGYSPPSVKELAATAGGSDKDLKLVLKLLEENGSAVRIKPDIYYAAGSVNEARQQIIDRCREAEKITLAEFRDLLGVSRKYAQALLEYFDRAGVTRRIEDYRVLRKKALTE